MNGNIGMIRVVEGEQTPLELLTDVRNGLKALFDRQAEAAGNIKGIGASDINAFANTMNRTAGMLLDVDDAVKRREAEAAKEEAAKEPFGFHSRNPAPAAATAPKPQIGFVTS